MGQTVRSIRKGVGIGSLTADVASTFRWEMAYIETNSSVSGVLRTGSLAQPQKKAGTILAVFLYV